MWKRQLIFNGANGSTWTWFIIAAIITALVLMVWLMKYERTLVSKKVGWTLLTLRLFILGVLLLTFLEPILAWTLDKERTGRILVAIDVSESMTTTDTHATKAEKLRWARALGIIGNQAIDERLDGWIQAYENDEEPVWVGANETKNANRRKTLEESRKENVEEIFKQIDKMSRKEIAQKLLQAGAYPLLPELEKIADVEIVLFAGDAQGTNSEDLENDLKEPTETLKTEKTNLGIGMTTLPSGSEGTSVLGVVMIGDGRNNSETDPVRIAAQLGYVKAPVYPVVVGSRFRPKDLAIATIDYPQTAFKEDSPVLTARVKTSGFEGEDIDIVLEQEDGEPITKTVRADGASATVEFQLDAETVGRRKYTIKTEVLPGETRDDNNEKSFAMNVVDGKVRVLLIEGEARWEFRFLEAALKRDDRVELKNVLFDQPYLGVLRDTFFPRRLRLPDPAAPDAFDNSPFVEPDLVIVGDVSPTDFPAEAWTLLEQFVSESGGTLVLLGGKRFMPAAHNSKTLSDMLPVRNLRPINLDNVLHTGSPTERGFRLELTGDGEREVMMQFDGDRIRNAAIWARLPGHLWGLLGEAKPSATVLAKANTGQGDDALRDERRSAVIVHHHYGSGQVMWLGIDSTWRWRHRVGDEYHHKFWGQLGRWAVENKALAGNKFVKLLLPRTDIDTGEDAIIQAQWVRQFIKKHPDAKARVEIYRHDDDTKPFTTLEMKPQEDRPLIHEARAVALPEGDYKVKLIIEGVPDDVLNAKQDDDEDENTDGLEAFLYVQDKQTLELLDLSANRKLLTQVAGVSSGKLFEPDQISKLPDMFRSPTEDIDEREETELWDHWIIMLVFFVLLTFEWVTRKLNGLP